jgi:hypothetical protein
VNDGISAITRKRRWTRSEAKAIVAAWRRSKLPLTKFASVHDLDPQRLARWKRELEVVPRLVEVVAASPTTCRLTIEVAGVRIVVEGDVSEELLARTLRAVKAC